ncbi:FAD-binding oxidoreductase [Sphingomonas jatrophae]|uniref:FAD/FMN-containing dehydrogenase n=1 Tax=Sphingomonas jatrophae TaxID=1166337 RepID=A0A1I6JT98_9SPHN|nr:FAD-binding oxidoreductase [Sphingomonas jatrophae]SFR82138.1 FAD/FMN-containing dehydrogenase [Sphingomonas jatrophae]
MTDDLRAILGPKGFTDDPVDMAPWLTDWRGRRTGRARALVSPASTQEAAAVARWAVANRVPIVPQGGNTSMVAGATPSADGDALILSTRRMARIRSISAEDDLLVAEAGVTLQTVHDAAEAAGRRFPLSLAAKGSATVGGLVSTNAGGTQVLRFGPMRALLLGIEAVLPDGSLFEGLSGLRKDNRGYDLRQLFAGAEGTLGIVTAAALRLVPAVAQRVVAWVGLPDAGSALTLLRRLEAATGDAVESFELVPANALALVLAHIPGTRAPLAGEHAWHVLVEATAVSAEPPLGSRIEAALADAAADGVVADAIVAASGAQADALWKLRESISEAERADGVAAKHDVSVPVAAMPGFIASARAATEARFPGTRVIAFGHLGDGNVHFNVRAPAASDGAAWLVGQGDEVSAFVHDLVGAAGGSISAEHGIGQLKLAEFARTAGSARLAAVRAIKAALDPLGIMNPGKLVPPPQA